MVIDLSMSVAMCASQGEVDRFHLNVCMWQDLHSQICKELAVITSSHKYISFTDQKNLIITLFNTLESMVNH